jgi:hypothetical protein
MWWVSNGYICMPFIEVETFARKFFNTKTHSFRHSREGGNPVILLISLDSRLRGNDDYLIFIAKS